MSPMNRRRFLKTTALGAAAAPSRLPSLMSQSPDERVRIGILGSGARAQGLMKELVELPGVAITSVCDAYEGRQLRAKSIAGGECRIDKDYRAILDRPDIDAVVIGSPDHWHLRMSLDAIDAGKDVYIEKPMTYQIDEGLQILDALRAQRSSSRPNIYQVGSQGISSKTQQKARELIQSGELGQVTLIRASYNRNTASGAWIYPIPPDASAETVNWKQFLGPAPGHTFDLDRFFRWRCYWDYSGGIATDLFVHLVTTINYVMDANMPQTVMAAGELYRWTKSRDVPDTINGIMSYPEGFTVNLSSTFNNQASSESGFEILGTKASIAFRGGRLTFTPENVYEDNRWVVESWERQLEKAYYDDPNIQAEETPQTWSPQMRAHSEVFEEWGHNATRTHLAQFVDSVRTRRPPVEDASMGHRAAACAHLINESVKRKAIVHWDFDKQRMA